jgi:hypothetical protein
MALLLFYTGDSADLDSPFFATIAPTPTTILLYNAALQQLLSASLAFAASIFRPWNI